MTYWLWSVPPENYSTYVRTGTFALQRQGRRALEGVRAGDRIFAYLPGSRVIAGLFEATGPAFEDATRLVQGGAYPHRVRVRALAVLPEESWVPFAAFGARLAVLREYAHLPTPDLRFRAVAQRVVHPLPTLDGKVLEFLVHARRGDDPEALMAAVEEVRRARAQDDGTPATPPPTDTPPTVTAEPLAPYAPPAPPSGFDRAAAVERLLEALAAQGYRFAPWVVAAYVAAVRTKPFAVLAGVTGVGKSRLPVLVAAATGGVATVLPVRPDWTDPGEALGYTDLGGRFRPGALLQAARAATEDPARHHTLVLDEMNLARPEHYLAEVLSRMEGRRPTTGGWASPPLLSNASGGPWDAVGLPPNLALVGTVNVDESAHPLSRKVLDRAFTLELDAPSLTEWSAAAPATGAAPIVHPWPASAWVPRAIRLGELGALAHADAARVEAAVTAMAEADALLAPAGLGVGYRARDEAALFVLHAAETPAAFRESDGTPVDPLDLALLMKLLPRLEGGRRAVRDGLLALLGWATDGTPRRDDLDAAPLLDGWTAAGRPAALDGARHPRTAARLARMAEAMLDDGFASFW